MRTTKRKEVRGYVAIIDEEERIVSIEKRSEYNNFYGFKNWKIVPCLITLLLKSGKKKTKT